MAEPTTPQTTVQRVWTISDPDEVDETIRVLHRLEIPYTLTFDGGQHSFADFSSWSVAVRFAGDILSHVETAAGALFRPCPRCQHPMSNLTGIFVLHGQWGRGRVEVCAACRDALIAEGWVVVAQQK